MRERIPKLNALYRSLVVSVCLTMGSDVNAQSDWNEPAGGNWNEPANWIGDVPNAVDSVATFGQNLPNRPVQVTLPEKVTLGQLIVNSSSTTFNGLGPFLFSSSTGGSIIDLRRDRSRVTMNPGVVIDDETSLLVQLSDSTELRLDKSISARTSDVTVRGSGTVRTEGFLSNWSGKLTVEESLVTMSDGALLGTGNSLPETGVALHSGAQLRLEGGTYQDEHFYLENSSLLLGRRDNVTINSPLNIVGSATIKAESSTVRLERPIDGNGGIRYSGSGAIRVLSNNAYSGITHIDGTVVIDNNQGLGTNSPGLDQATFINSDGRLGLRRPLEVDERIVLNGGILTPFDSSTISLNGVTEVRAPSSLGGGSSNGQLVFVGDLVGDQPLVLIGNRIVINHDTSFAGSFKLESGILVVGSSGALGVSPTVRLSGGGIEANAPLTVDVEHASHYRGFFGGSSQLNMNVDDFIIKSARFRFRDDGMLGNNKITQAFIGESDSHTLGRNAMARIEIERGVFAGTGEFGFGSPSVPTYVGARNAVASVYAPTTEDFQLDNATGFLGRGGLVGFSGGFDREVRNVDLGENGSVLAEITITGKISGGSLATTDRVSIASGGHDFTGRTEIRGGMWLIDEGSLQSTSSIEIRNGLLFLDGPPSGDIDRVGDQIPIHMKRAEIRTDSNIVGRMSEKLGHVLLESGRNRLTLHWGGGQRSATNLHIDQLIRAPGATIEFRNETDAILGRPTSDSPKFTIENPPSLTNQIMAPWVLLFDDRKRGYDFATYDAERGVLPLGIANRPDDLNLANPSDNVLLKSKPLPLSRDVEVHTLASEFDRSFAMDLDLGGRRLAVLGGAILHNPVGGTEIVSIRNGRLTAGRRKDANELIVYTQSSNQRLEIGASIIDNQDAPLTLVKGGDYELFLTGDNRYSGGTVVNDGVLWIQSHLSLPQKELVVNGGIIHFDFENTEPFQFPSLTMRGDGRVGAECCDPIGQTIDSNQYDLESGTLGQPMVGNGPMIKSGPGIVHLRHNRSGYSGPIEIEEGILLFGDERDSSRGTPLGTGEVHLNGGALVNAHGGVVRSPIRVKSGSIAPQDADRIFRGTLDVVGSLELLTFDGLYEKPAALGLGRGIVSRNLTFQGDTTLRDLSVVELVGDGEVTFRRTFLDGHATVLSDEMAVIFDRPIVALAEQSRLELHGPLPMFNRGFEVAGGRILSISNNDDKATVSLNNGFAVLAGGGVFEANVTLSSKAKLSPGDTVGALGINGQLSLEAGAEYEWEIHDATGIGGVGWDLTRVSGGIRLESTRSSPIVIDLQPVNSNGSSGAIQNFDPRRSHEWEIAISGDLDGFDEAFFSVDRKKFDQNHVLPKDASIDVAQQGNTLNLVYVPSIIADADGSGALDVGDIGMFCAHVGSNNERFDLDTNGIVNLEDVNMLLSGFLLSTWGDSNLDGVFDSADLVIVFQQGRYEDGADGNAGWLDGDWNCDLDFDSADLVHVFQLDTYTSGAVQPVPEPSHPVWVALGIAIIAGSWRKTRTPRFRHGHDERMRFS